MTVSQLKQAVRVALTGVENGAPIVDVMMVLGKAETLKRLRAALMVKG